MPDADPADDGGAAIAPSREMRLLLAAAMDHGERAQEAWASWLGAVDLDHLEQGATALLSLVSRNLDELRADPSGEGRVRGVHRQTWARNQLLWAAGAPLVDRLGEVAGPPLLLPATALLATYDGDWGARPLGRITVALDPAAVDLARGALAAQGWAVDHVTPRLLARTRAGLVERWQSQDRSGNWVTIRWHVLRQVSSAVADEQLRGAAVTTAVGSSRVHLLHPADALLERLWNSSGERSPGWIADAVQLARVLAADGSGRPAAVTRFAERAHQLGIQPVVRQRLELVAATLPDPAVVAALAAVREARPVAASRLWVVPGPAGHLGRAWAGHAAGQGVASGARSLLRARWAGRRLRYRGSAQRR